jgi:hypothetical protein
VGWIPAATATLRPTQSRIVVHRGLERESEIEALPTID